MRSAIGGSIVTTSPSARSAGASKPELPHDFNRNVGDVSKALETALGEAESVKIIWKPKNSVPVDEDRAQSLMKLVATLEDDDDVQTDGCVRIASLTDTASEPTGFIFTASGRTAYVNLQHRSTNTGAVLKITGFRVRDHRDHEDGDHDDDDHGHGGHKDK